MQKKHHFFFLVLGVPIFGEGRGGGRGSTWLGQNANFFQKLDLKASLRLLNLLIHLEVVKLFCTSYKWGILHDRLGHLVGVPGDPGSHMQTSKRLHLRLFEVKRPSCPVFLYPLLLHRLWDCNNTLLHAPSHKNLCRGDSKLGRNCSHCRIT